MATKEIYLYDVANKPLGAGVAVELAETASGTLLATQHAAGLPGGECMATLSFAPVGGAVDIFIIDPTYRYPGNMVHSINGTSSDVLRLDLLSLPTSPSATVSTAKAIGRSVKRVPHWSNEERDAVLNLCFNYALLVARLDLLPSHELAGILTNWQEALRRLRISPDIFS